MSPYCDYFNNKPDHYKISGLAFIMLMSALFLKEFKDTIKAGKGKRAQDCLLEACAVKAYKR